MFPQQTRNNIISGIVLMGTTGLLIGYFLHSPLVMILAGALGVIIGWLVGWLEGRRFMVLILLGTGIGAFFGYQSGDQDVMIMATGSGAAIAGFLGAQMERFFKRP